MSGPARYRNGSAAKFRCALPLAAACSLYAHLFEQTRHADELRDRMAAGYGRLLDVNEMSTTGRTQAKPEPAKIAVIKAFRG